MRISSITSLWVSLLGSAAWAQVNPCASGQGNICVSYTTGTQSVPLTPAAMGILLVSLGVLAFFKLRKSPSGFFGLFLSAALVGLVAYQTMGVSLANGYTRVYMSAGNPVVTASNGGNRVVVNDLSNNATITSILIDGMTYQVTGQQLGYEECSVGKVLVPTTGGTSGMCVVVLPVG